GGTAGRRIVGRGGGLCGSASFREHDSGEAGRARRIGMAMVREYLERSALRCTGAAEKFRVHGGYRDHVGTGYRREHSHLQRVRRGLVKAAAVYRSEEHSHALGEGALGWGNGPGSAS